MAHEARVLDVVQQHVGDAEHVGKLLLLHRAQGALHLPLVGGLLHIAVAHMADGAGEKAARAASRIEQDFAGMRIDAVHHEGGDGARRVIFARIAGRLQIGEDLLVDLAKMLPVGERIEIDAVDLVDHLAHELAGFHVVVGVFEHVAYHAAAVAGFAGELEAFERREQLAVDEAEQRLAGYALRVPRPGAPLETLRDRRAIAGLGQLQFLVLIVDDLEEEHPAQLADALRIAIDADVLAHDVLDGFDGGADGHGLCGLLIGFELAARKQQQSVAIFKEIVGACHQRRGRMELLRYLLATLAVSPKWRTGSFRKHRLAMLDHQLERGFERYVLAIVQGDRIAVCRHANPPFAEWHLESRDLRRFPVKRRCNS